MGIPDIKAKLLKIALVAVISAVALFAAKTIFENYTELVKERAEFKQQRDNVIAINAALNAQLVEFVKDAKQREQVDKDISTETAELNDQIGSLESDLAASRKERDRLKGKLDGMNTTTPSKPTVITEEIDVTWQAYCKATLDPKCKSGG